MPKVLETVTRKAKKEHCCDYCGLKIEIGEIYEDQTNVFDNELYHWKSHLSCKELTKKLDMFSGCDDDGLTADYFQELVNDFLYGEDICLKTWSERITKVKEILCTPEPPRDDAHER